MKLDWKSYGDTGRVADGNLGKWRIVTDGMRWHLSVDGLPRGDFALCGAANSRAQELENAHAALPTCQYGTVGCGDPKDHYICELT